MTKQIKYICDICQMDQDLTIGTWFELKCVIGNAEFKSHYCSSECLYKWMENKLKEKKD